MILKLICIKEKHGLSLYKIYYGKIKSNQIIIYMNYEEDDETKSRVFDNSDELFITIEEYRNRKLNLILK